MQCVFSFFNPFSCLSGSSWYGYSALNAPINSLPEELILHIFSFLAVRGLATAEQVCRQWKRIGGEDALWKLHYQRFFGPHPIGYTSPEGPYSFKESYLIKSESKAWEIYCYIHKKKLPPSKEVIEWWIKYKKKGGVQSQFKKDPAFRESCRMVGRI